MNEPEPPNLNQSIETLMSTSNFQHLSEEIQNEIIFYLIKDHDNYKKKVTNFYGGLKP